MKRLGIPIALLVVFVVGLVVALVGPVRVPASSLSKGPSGWLAARLFLERSEADPELFEQREVLGSESLLVELFPWPLSPSRHADRLRRVREQRAAGGDLLLAYSGKDGAGEKAFFEDLGLPLERVRPRPPIAYGPWKRHQQAVWTLEPVADDGLVGLKLPAPTWVPAAPDDAEVLYRGPAGEGLVFVLHHGGGRTVVLPASLWANGGLWRGDNAAFLLALAERFPQSWLFDEQGLGVEDPAAIATAGHYRRVFTWFGLHLLVLYGLGVLALARRFGPPWREPPVLVGSTGAFLRGLGRIHRQSGHHRAAARALLDRSDEWVEGRSVPATWRAEAAAVEPSNFLPWARRLARWRRHKG